MARLIAMRATAEALAGVDTPPERRQDEYVTVSVDPERCKTALGQWLAANVHSTLPNAVPRLMVQLNMTRAEKSFRDFAFEAQKRRLRDRAEATQVLAELDAYAAAQAELIAASSENWFERATVAFEWPVLGEPASEKSPSLLPDRAATLQEAHLREELRYLCELGQRRLLESELVFSFLRTYVARQFLAHEDEPDVWFREAVRSPRPIEVWHHSGQVPSEVAAYFDYCAKLLDWELLARQAWFEGTAVRAPDELLMMQRRARRAGPPEPAAQTESLSY